jgi:thioredoxin 1
MNFFSLYILDTHNNFGCFVGKQKLFLGEGMTDIKNEQEFIREIKSGIVVADFYADWCSPCKLMMPVLQQISDEMSDVKFLKVNVETCLSVPNLYNISSIPSILIFRNGSVTEQMTGIKDAKKIKNSILNAKQ